jgi:alkylation response protein AidB-like acyl-CoA dehydrogenase
MPGVQAGDLGPKMGANTLDNGFVIFDQVRIPRFNMLSRFCEVCKEGKFKVKGDLRTLYAVMVNTRQLILANMGDMLLRGCLIATRYAVCKK